MRTRLRRRGFLQTAGAAAVAGFAGAPALLGSRNLNNVVGLAVIGAGARGIQLLKAANGTPGASIRVVADLDSDRLARARQISCGTDVHLTTRWREAIERAGVDAVLVASPDFWHAPMTIAAANAGKHVYVEPHLCLDRSEAEEIRASVEKGGVVFSLGHQLRVDPAYRRARDLFRNGALGDAKSVTIRVGRSPAWPEWTSFGGRRIEHASAAAIDWAGFERTSNGRDGFDESRFMRWRCYWEYGTGIAGSLMSHHWDAMNMVLGLGLPESVSTQVDLSYWRNGVEAPDSWRCLFAYPTRALSIDFQCDFRSGLSGSATRIRTTTGEIDLVPTESGVSAPHRDLLVEFVNCVRRGRKSTSCGLESALQVAAAVDMSVESYRRGRSVEVDAPPRLVS